MHLHDAQEDNLLTVLTSAFLDMKRGIAQLKSKPEGSFGNERGRRTGRGRGGRGLNIVRYGNIQCFNCGEFGHIVRTCTQLIQGEGDSQGVNQTQTSYAPSPIRGQMNSSAGGYTQPLTPATNGTPGRLLFRPIII